MSITSISTRKKMEYGYVIIDKKKRKWYCLWMCKKVVKSKYKDDLPTQIFNDEQFTYFKFNRSNARIDILPIAKARGF
ncbi:hypothetical protein MMM114_14110 [Helicobacter pylori]